MLEWNDVSIERDGRRLLDRITMRIGFGELVAIVGPNGAGKSTLLKAMTGEWPLAGGRVSLFGQPLAAWSRLELARRFGALPQRSSLAFDFLVEEVVAIGRLPYRARSPAEDAHAVSSALIEVGLEGFGRRRYLALSGGEQQRVQVARLLAQMRDAATHVFGGAMLLDEPTSALDLGQQQRLLDLLWTWTRKGYSIGVVLHDLNLAARYADRIVLVDQGRVQADGVPGEVLSAELLAKVYGCDVAVRVDPRDQRPQVSLAGPSRLGLWQGPG